jgi:hypothetical protein
VKNLHISTETSIFLIIFFLKKNSFRLMRPVQVIRLVLMANALRWLRADIAQKNAEAAQLVNNELAAGMTIDELRDSGRAGEAVLTRAARKSCCPFTMLRVYGSQRRVVDQIGPQRVGRGLVTCESYRPFSKCNLLRDRRFQAAQMEQDALTNAILNLACEALLVFFFSFFFCFIYFVFLHPY